MAKKTTKWQILFHENNSFKNLETTKRTRQELLSKGM